VQGALAVVEQALVGHLMCERVLECVFHFRERLDLVEEFRGLQAGKLGTHPLLRGVDNSQQ